MGLNQGFLKCSNRRKLGRYITGNRSTKCIKQDRNRLTRSFKESLGDTLLFSPLSRITPEISTTMAEIRYATDNNRKVSLQYSRADGQSSERIIWPLGLFFWGTTWTIGAWCEMRNNFRVFRLDRIKAMVVLDESYPKEKDKSLQAMIGSEKDCGW